MKDVMGMMKQVQAMQSKMQDLQAELERTEVEGVAGGGLVKVRLTAKGEMKGVTVDASLMKPEETEILEDLLLAAHNDARAKGEACDSVPCDGSASSSPTIRKVCFRPSSRRMVTMEPKRTSAVSSGSGTTCAVDRRALQ